MASVFEKYPYAIIGFLILFIGWFSVFTGFAGIILAEDFEFFIEIEDMVLIKQIIPEEEIQLQMAFRMFFGFILVFIGNSFLLESKILRKKFCKPCVNDLRKLK